MNRSNVNVIDLTRRDERGREMSGRGRRRRGWRGNEQRLEN